MSSHASFPIGKLPARLLQTLLASCPVSKSSRVIKGPRYGEDATVIDMGATYLVAKTDPITFTAERLGWYAVNINANDIATLGARPRWFLATILLPEGRTTEALVRNIFRDVLDACQQLGVALCGGHTEITSGLSRPILVGQMLGEMEKSKLVRKESQQPGDLVILTKGVALEGTAILARKKAAWLKRRVGRRSVQRAQHLLFDPGISVVREALVAARTGGVRAMHDPTEGGLLAGLYELARAGQVGLRLWKEKTPVLPETQAFAQALHFDPLALIASGSLLIVASPRAVPNLLAKLKRRKISAAVIAEICREEEGIRIIEGGKSCPLRVPARDEIARLLKK